MGWVGLGCRDCEWVVGVLRFYIQGTGFLRVGGQGTRVLLLRNGRGE